MTAPSLSPTQDSLGYRVGHQAFLLGLVLKGINAAFELVVGALLLVLPFATLQAWAAAAAAWVVTVVPPGWAGRFGGVVDKLAPETVSFVAWYFLSHGVLKGLVIACLALGKLWAYPLGIAVFLGFGIYQTWEYFLGGSVFYLVLDVLDLALIGLTILEWVHATRKAPAVDKSPT